VENAGVPDGKVLNDPLKEPDPLASRLDQGYRDRRPGHGERDPGQSPARPKVRQGAILGKEAGEDAKRVEDVPSPDSIPVRSRYQTEVGSLTRQRGGEASELADLICAEPRQHALRVKFHVKQGTAAAKEGRGVKGRGG
jgi:hypothetical protein